MRFAEPMFKVLDTWSVEVILSILSMRFDSLPLPPTERDELTFNSLYEILGVMN